MPCLNCGHEIHEGARFCARCGAPQTVGDGGLGGAKSPLLSGNQYVRALRRFWWLLVLGLGVAAIAAIAAVYRIDFGSVPPSLEKRDQVTYTAVARLLVTSAEAPYFRTTVTRELPGEEGEPAQQELAGAPDLGTLISTANLYPILVESDAVRQQRQEMFGPLPGSITTRAIYEVNSPGRFELSQVPVIEVYGHADTYAGSVELTQATVEAFEVYVDETQDEAGLRRQERILLQEIQRPETAVASGGTSASLPLMLFVVVAGAFVALAILLDRLFPFGLRRRRHAAPEPAAAEAPRDETASQPKRKRSKASV